MDPTYQIDLDTGALTWNEAFYAQFGYATTEPVNSMEWWTSHVHPEDAMLLNNALDQLVLTTRTSWVVAYRFRKADGSYVVVTDHAAVKRDYAGNAVHLTGVLTTEPTTGTT